MCLIRNRWSLKEFRNYDTKDSVTKTVSIGNSLCVHSTCDMNSSDCEQLSEEEDRMASPGACGTHNVAQCGAHDVAQCGTHFGCERSATSWLYMKYNACDTMYTQCLFSRDQMNKCSRKWHIIAVKSVAKKGGLVWMGEETTVVFKRTSLKCKRV